KTIPEALSKNKISDDVLQFAGEVLGDYKNKSVPINEKWQNNDLLLIDFINLLKDKDHEEYGFALHNILKIIELVRGEFTGIDLSNLDFKNVDLNKKILGRT
ncbi:MAG: hypothetical protein ABF289_17680, partial [Clostridiales bacterium]